MNSSRFDNSDLRPIYMSQDEANEVMELYAERQRQEAARQSLITVHDVAEATQLSTQDVERLLQEVRSGRPATAPVSVRTMTNLNPTRDEVNEISYLSAYKKLAPASAVLAVWLSLFLQFQMRYDYYQPQIRGFSNLLLLYVFAFCAVYAHKAVKKMWLNRDQALIASHRSNSL